MNPEIHINVYDILNDYYANTGCMFLARVNRCNKLYERKLFRGSDSYLQSTFWTGNDDVAKIYNIGIGVKMSKGVPLACFDMCCRGNLNLINAFNRISNEIHNEYGLDMMKGNTEYWSLLFGGDYTIGLHTIINDIKHIVDNVIENNNYGINAISRRQFERSMNTIAPFIAIV